MCHKEDDRIANIVFMIYKINLVSNEKLIEWFEKLCRNCNFSEKQDKYISSVNFRNFIRSLYFKFKHYQCEEEILNVILNVERKLNSTIY
jgi:hypothetical protein